MGLFESFQELTEAQREAFVLQVLADDDLAAAVVPSEAQQRIIFVSTLDGGGAAYNLPYAGRVHGPLDVPALRRAYEWVLERHEQLRRRFVRTAGHLLSLVSDQSTIIHHDCHGLDRAARDRDARARALDDASAVFDVLGGPLSRLTTVEYAVDDFLVMVTVSHAVADGWSLAVLFRDLSTAYADIVAGRAPGAETKEREGSFSDHVGEERRAARDGSRKAALERWARLLDDAPASIGLPVDASRPRTQDFRGADAELVLPPWVGRAIREVGASISATPFMVCLAIFGHTLSRYSGDRDLVVGTPIAGRRAAHLDDVVGMFVNTVPVRLHVEQSESLRQLLMRTRSACLHAFELQDVPLNAIVDRLAPRRDLARPPLFQTTFAYADQDTGGPATLDLGPLDVHTVDVPGTTAKFELSLTVHELQDGGLRLALEYAQTLFDASTADRILASFGALAAAASDPSVDPRTIVSPTEARPDVPQRLACVPWNDPRDLLELVAAAAEANPKRIAIRCDEEEYSYERLLAEAHTLGDALASEGIGVGSRVGIMLERTPRLLVSMLAVFALGGSYVPLDPTYPEPRLKFMLEDANCVALIADVDVVPGGSGTGIQLFRPGSGATTTVGLGRASRVPGPAAEAYVLYTSGSTGIPKGVSVPHKAVLAMVRGTWQLFDTPYLMQSLATTSISFDVSTVEIFPTLGLGGTVHLATSLFDVPPAHGPRPTFTAGVPSLLGAALEAGTIDVSDMVVAAGGESLRGELVRDLYVAGAAQVVNIYGPSEDCTYSTSAFIAPGTDRPAIGQSVPESRAYVLDQDGYPLPTGAVGEIFLAGSGLADGYVERPALTASRFVPDPFSVEGGQRMYRTGDLGRFRSDGELEYLGRVDRQVKVNGMRIELGEVESALLRVEGVSRCVAVVQGTAGQARLGAVFEASSPADITEIRRLLLETLPRHLVPAVLVQVDNIPHLPNGKTDTDRVLAELPPLPGSARPEDRQVVDDGSTAAAVRRLWGVILPEADTDGDFFSAGGNSLAALRLALLVRDEFAVSFSIVDVFTARTVVEMARLIDASPERAVRPLPRHDDVRQSELSREQFRLWFLEQVSDLGAAYVIPVGWVLSGVLNVASLESAVGELQLRHPALRLRIGEIDGEPRTFDGEITELRITHEPGIESDEAAAERFDAFASMPFDLDGGSLFRAELIAVREDRHLLMLAAHHVVLDGWSLGILEDDLTTLSMDGDADGLPPAGASYRDHVVWQAEDLALPQSARGVERWQNLLGDAPTLLTLGTRPLPAARSSEGSSVRCALTEPTACALQRLADEFDVTPFVASSLVFGLTLAAIAGVDDVLFGTPVSGRYDHRLNRTVGMFANTVVLRVDVRQDPSIADLVGSYRAFTESAYSHQDVPFDAVVEALAPVRSAAHPTLIQATFSYDYSRGSQLRLPGVEVREMEGVGTTSKFDIAATVGRGDRDFEYLTVEYSTDVLGGDDVQRVVRLFEAIARSVADGQDQPVSKHLDQAQHRARDRA